MAAGHDQACEEFWLNVHGNTPGTSLALSTFFVVQPSSTVAQINAALAAGDNLLFTPGVYDISSTINVTNAGPAHLGDRHETVLDPGDAVNRIAEGVESVIAESGVPERAILGLGVAVPGLE